jgi:hypothetical protein
MNQDKEVQIDPAELKRAVADDFEQMLKDTAEALNKARDGAIIADSELIVRDAMARFRQKVYQKAVQMKADKAAKAAFPPSAQQEGDAAKGQGNPGSQSSDGQRHDPH